MKSLLVALLFVCSASSAFAELKPSKPAPLPDIVAEDEKEIGRMPTIYRMGSSNQQKQKPKVKHKWNQVNPNGTYNW